MFQRFGIMGDYFADRGQLTPADLGRFNQTGNESDRYVFKVPSLRNVEHTAPYFHDGSTATLEGAIQIMGRYQLGPGAVLQIQKRGTSLTAQLTGQPPLPIFAASEQRFFLKVVDAQLSFEVDASGSATAVTLHQNGVDQRAPRIE